MMSRRGTLSELKKLALAAAVLVVGVGMSTGGMWLIIDDYHYRTSFGSPLQPFHYNATADVCLGANATPSEYVVPKAEDCMTNGRIYSCGCANCTIVEPCSEDGFDKSCACPDGIVFPDGLKYENPITTKGVIAYLLFLAGLGLFMLAVLYIIVEAPDRCQNMEENDEDQSYHRLNAICCTNGAARALLALASPIVSVLGIILAVLNLIMIITLPCALLACRGGNIGDLFRSLKFAFQNMIPYPIFAGKALLKKLHPCACWRCAEKLDQCTDGVKYKTKVDDEQELTQV